MSKRMSEVFGLAVFFLLVLDVSFVSAAFPSLENCKHDYDVSYRFAQVKYSDGTTFTYRYDYADNKIHKKAEGHGIQATWFN